MKPNPMLVGSSIEPAGLESIATDWGLLSLLAVGTAILFFLIWYYAFERPARRKRLNAWLNRNASKLRELQELKFLVASIGEGIEPCHRCGNDKMQLWKQQQHVLVIRCRSCQMNYSLTRSEVSLIPEICLGLQKATNLVRFLDITHNVLLARSIHKKLKMDRLASDFEKNLLASFQFTARKGTLKRPISIKDVYLHEWEIVASKEVDRIAS